MIEKCIELILPIPISINQAYSGYKKRHKSDEYKNWELLAFIELQKQKEYSIIGDNWLLVEYEFNFELYTIKGKKKIKDVFNYEKVLSDFLAKHIKGFKDHKIKTGIVRKIDSKNEFVKIKIKEI